MRFYLGHKLPFGFWGAAGFGSYAAHRSVLPEGHVGRGVSGKTVGFVLGMALVLLWLFTR